ncbi:hypothetical protein H9Q74_008457 [Fusarium xylarioides]|nr:hypothetical protein H9Q71_009945 [Fusarium xylarioides]KAG5821162.1 hypothetical protein H9Q74_008457 [Fusarium xylarioides]
MSEFTPFGANAIHLLRCAQPAHFDVKAAGNRKLTAPEKDDASNESISTFTPESDTDEHAVNDGDDTDGSDDVETKKEDEKRTFRLGFRRESRDWEIEDWESEDRFALRPGNPLRYVCGCCKGTLAKQRDWDG